jgi:hypothetical protein
MKLYIIAHTEVQLDMFMRQHHIDKSKARRVREDRDVFGVIFDSPLVLLPGWQESHGSPHDAVNEWLRRGGKTLSVSEDQALGRKSLCIHDTNNDGDCHLCVRMGCCWPNGQTK